MSQHWSPEQVLALAPDAASAKSGRELATSRKWLRVENAEGLLWGECQGSGKDPYRTVIDLSEPAFSCTCPSRKFPCKHGLGLLLLYAQQPGIAKDATAPDWVTKWTEGRAARAQKRAAAAEVKRDDVTDVDAQAKRQAARAARVDTGIADLKRWLEDLVRAGFTHAQSQPDSYWSMQAARLIDAQAPGLASLVKALAGVPASGQGWESRLLAQIARLHLLIEAYSRLDLLPAATQADVRAAVGWTVAQEDVLAQPGCDARWLIAGRRIDDEDRLRIQRTWLWSPETQQTALALHFAAGGQTLDVSLVPGMAFRGELVFYPSAAPLRALVKTRAAALPASDLFEGHVGFADALRAYGDAMARNPWRREYLMVVNEVLPVLRDDGLFLIDSARAELPIARGFGASWTLLALSGGRPLRLCAEFDGESLWPLSALADGRLVVM